MPWAILINCLFDYDIGGGWAEIPNIRRQKYSQEVTVMARKGENIFKRKDGRWEARYIKGRHDGKAVYGYVFGKSYTEAKKKKMQAITLLTQEFKISVTQGEQPGMRDICELWMEDLKPVCKKSTLAKYHTQIQNHIIPAFGDRKIDEIFNDDIISFSRSLLSGTNGENGLAPKTVSDIISRLKSIRRFALAHGYVVHYTSDCVAIPQKAKPLRVLTFSEEEKLFHYLKANPSLTGLGILICLFTGIRIGELCALTWCDISLEERQFYIRHTMQRLPNRDSNASAKTYIEIAEPKSECSVRMIPIPGNIMEELQAAYATEAYLLTGTTQWYIEPRTMENRFKKILKECGIADANFHTLRHTFATRCVEVGFDIKTLSEILGHANINITLNRYVHPTMRLKRENMDKLSDLFAVR